MGLFFTNIDIFGYIYFFSEEISSQDQVASILNHKDLALTNMLDVLQKQVLAVICNAHVNRS